MNPEHTTPLSEFQLVVVNPQGKLKEIYCPFRVQCIERVVNIPADAWVYVEMVSSFHNNELIYQINGRWYPFESFIIVIHF